MRADPLSPGERSALMARVRGKNTGPERAIRKLVSSLGYRYRLHLARLPGRPDLAFVSLRRVIFVHGCFWHVHAGCGGGRIPRTRRDYWRTKLLGNRRRDRRSVSDLKKMGWSVLVVWECELGDPSLPGRVARFLAGRAGQLTGRRKRKKGGR